MTLLTAGHGVERDDLGYAAFLIGMLEGMATARDTVRSGLIQQMTGAHASLDAELLSAMATDGARRMASVGFHQLVVSSPSPTGCSCMCLSFCLILYYWFVEMSGPIGQLSWIMPIVSVSQCAGGRVLACPAVPNTTIQAYRHACCNV